MFVAKMAKILLRTLVVVSCLFLLACNGADTDGDSGAEEAESSAGQFVSDGAAGATLEITLTGSLRTGGTTGFFVRALDPSGAPLAFLRITCDSELGIAILEPSTGAESTDSSGAMSGRLGGLTPGSFILECRGPFGTNLVDRISIVISGSVPDGFAGFPGAAGGTLFGGNLQDLTPDFVPGEGIFISNTLFGDAGGEDETGLLDSVWNDDCDGDGVGIVGPPPDVDRDGDGLPDDDSPADDFEPFIPYTYNILLANNTAERVTTQDITFTLVGEGVTIATGTIDFIAQVEPGTTVNLTGEFVDEVTLPGGGGVITAILFGSASPIVFDASGNGTYLVTITVSGFSETGETVVLTDTESLAFTGIDNCAS